MSSVYQVTREHYYRRSMHEFEPQGQPEVKYTGSDREAALEAYYESHASDSFTRPGDYGYRTRFWHVDVGEVELPEMAEESIED